MPIIQSYIVRMIPLLQGRAYRAQLAELLRRGNRIVLGVGGGEGLVFGGECAGALQESGGDVFVFRV